ncbi:RabGAP/TBC [Backusella circina FSU 941]|nr:RabGAP/TBC [Backusella circina FSU 941]
MGGGSIYKTKKDNNEEQSLLYSTLERNNSLNSISTSTSASSYISVYPTYDPTEFQVEPVPLTVPELPPRPLAYQQELHQQQQQQQQQQQDRENPMHLIYIKSGFYVKSQHQDELIHGFFTIFSKSMDDIDILISWIPEYAIEPHDLSLFLQLDGIVAADDGFPLFELHKQSNSIQLGQIASLYVSPPTATTQGSIIITSCTGEIQPQLLFSATEHDPMNTELNSRAWPGYDIMDVLSAFEPIQNLEGTEHMYLVTSNHHVQPSPPLPSKRHSYRSSYPPPPSPLQVNPLVQSLHDARWNLLERLSRVTQISKETAAQVLDMPISKPLIPLLPPAIQALSHNRTVITTCNEYPAASNYLAHYNPTMMQHQQEIPNTLEALLHGMPELSGPMPIHTRTDPITPEVWIALFDQHGRLNCPVEHVHQLVFRGGLHPDIRIEAWKFLLGIYPWYSTFDDREAIRRSRADAYYRIKSTWFDHMEIRDTPAFKDEKHRIDKDVHRTDRSQEAFASESLPNPDLAMDVGTNENLETMKDILVTYNYHNTELGYVQGMSDLLAPLFVAMGDEAMAFWGFVKFMDRVQSNFFIDQSGMHGQLKTLNMLIQFMDPELHAHLEKHDCNNLFFCFRWLLVWFKREFEWEDVIRLWEVLWSNWLTDKMTLFIALAVLEVHRDKILNDLNQFDEILRFVNDLTGKIELETTLQKAEVLFYQFERKVRAMQHKKVMLRDQLEIRSVWNSDQRPKIQQSMELLNVPQELLSILPPLDA